MQRRDFFVTAAAGIAAAAGAIRPGLAQGQGAAPPATPPPAGGRGPAGPLVPVKKNPPNPKAAQRIAMMTLNFGGWIKDIPDVQPNPYRSLAFFDLPQMVADVYDVHMIEYQSAHFESHSPAYFKSLRAALEKSKSRASQINAEFGALNMAAPNVGQRLQAIALTKHMIDCAVMLGAQRVMLNQGQATLGSTNLPQAIAAFKEMSDYGKSRKIIVSIETRLVGGGGAAAPARAGAPAEAPRTDLPKIGLETWQQNAALIKGAGAYANPDVGNTNAMNQQELHQCLSRELMFPTSGAMHARIFPTNAQGEKRWDLTEAIKYLTGLGYTGIFTCEGGGGHEACQPIYEAVLAAL
jgi:hypothetical protein